MSSTYLGIDVSKASLDVCLFSDGDQKYSRFDNTKQGFSCLKKWLGGIAPAISCMEATGIYHEEVAQYLYDLGLRVAVVNPALVKYFGQSCNLRTKTDKVDAALLANFAARQQPDAWAPPAKEVRNLRDLSRARQTMVEARAQLKNNMSSLPAHASELKKHWQPLIDSHTREIDALMKKMLKLIKDNPNLSRTYQLLIGVKGIGPVTALILIAEVGDWAAFASAPELSAHSGLTPRHYQSGQIDRHGGITKIGNVRIRTALYMAALAAMRSNPIIIEFAERLEARGKKKMVIVVACMNKLLRQAYGVVAHETEFNPEYLAQRLEQKNKLAA